MDSQPWLSLLSSEFDELDGLCAGFSFEHLDSVVSKGSFQGEPIENLIREMPQSEYSSVLKLPDVASALKSFSRTSPALSAALPQPRRASQSINVWRDGQMSVTGFPEENIQRKALADWKTVFQGGPTTPGTEWASYDEKIDMLSGLKRWPLREEGASQREIRMHSERKRRRSMRDQFAVLQSLIPRRKLVGTDRITVLTEVITHIQSLRRRLEELDRKKADILELLGVNRSYQWDNTPPYGTKVDVKIEDGLSVEVNIRLSGSDVHLIVNTPKKRGLWSTILTVLHRHRIEVINASLASSKENHLHHIHGKVRTASRLDKAELQKELEDVIMKELKRRPRFSCRMFPRN